MQYACATFEDLDMALKATIYKANLAIADMDRHVYADYALTIAQHPSETIERMMVRLLAFARYAHEELQFTQDLFEEGEPALWQKDLTGQLQLWLEVGQPSEDKVKKASARSDKVAIVTYGSSVAEWWKKNPKIKTLSNVEVWQIAAESAQALQTVCARTMQLQLNIMEGDWVLIGDDTQVEVQWTQLQ